MKKQGGKKRGRFYFLLLILGVIIISGWIGYQVLSLREISFEEAQEKPELRDAYIEKILAKIGKPEYIEEINYLSPEELQFIKKEYGVIPNPRVRMVTQVDSFTTKKEGPVIYIFPFPFNEESSVKREEDFISCFFHEYTHAEDIYFQRVDSIKVSAFKTTEGKLNKELREDIFELAAIRKEFSLSLNISPEYQEDILLRYLIEYTDIWDHSEGMKPEFIKLLKTEYFHPHLLESPDLVRRNNIWYFENPKTKRKYYLPQEIVEKYTNGKGYLVNPCHFFGFLMKTSLLKN